MSFTSTTRLKSALRMPAGVTFHDVVLGSCADAANDFLLDRMGLSSLALTTRFEYPVVFGSRQRRIQLQRWPVSSVVVVTNAGAALGSATFRTDTELGSIYLSPTASGSPVYWSDAPDDVEVMYVHGWTPATVPEKFRNAADALGIYLFNRGPSQGIASERRGPISLTLRDEELPAEVRLILAGYVDHHGP